MSNSAISGALQEAFGNDPQLHGRVHNAAFDLSLAPLLYDIANYINHLRATLSSIDSNKRELLAPTNGDLNTGEPASKKRRIGGTGSDVQSMPVNHGSSRTWLSRDAAFIAPDISFAVPVRKKLRLEIVSTSNNGVEGGIRGIDVKTGEAEIAVAWNDIDQIISVPVPEKATPANHFVIITTPSSITTSTNSPTHEPIVFTVSAVAAKVTTFPGIDLREGETFEALMRRVLDQELQRAKGQHAAVVVPDAKEFASGVVQAHRKGEKAWHVKAWRGSKDGYLYFLGPGILSAFRKPLLFFPLHAINSISYSSILQRTFNLNISTSNAFANSGNQEEEQPAVEFSMLDQADFAGIDAYIKRHGLNDASLAAGRRAKFYNVNPNSKGATRVRNGVSATSVANDVAEEEENEEDPAAQAEKQLQDAEDAEEEDYDPSGGESEGSGTDSEDDDGYANGRGDGGDAVEKLGTDEEADQEVGGYEDEEEGGD